MTPSRYDDAASRWNEKYGSRSSLYSTEPTEFLRRHLEELGSGRALDLACGEGRNAVFLAEQGFEVTAVDISQVAVDRCRQLSRKRGVRLDTIVADLRDFDLGRSRWDCVSHFYFLDRSLFAPICDALKPGGVLILEHFATDHPQRGGPFGPTNPDYLLDPKEALEAFRHLDLMHFEHRVVGLGEGMHRGPASLVRLIAKRPSA